MTTSTSTWQTIAVGFDGSVPAVAALDWAAAAANRTGATLRIICVIHYPGMPAGTVEFVPKLPESLLNRAHKLALDEALRARNVLGVARVETQIVVGTAAEALVTATESAQLLVVGNRGRSELGSIFLGSVSFAVAAHARCPVTVVREGAVLMGPEHGVVVGVDGSPAGDRALDVAADVADRAGAPLRIISAWDLPAAESWAFSYWETASVSSDWARTQHDIAVKVATAAADRAHSQHPGLAATSEVYQGPAGAALNDASHNAGLVVVGSRGLGGFAGLVLGSVSHNAIHGCVCPVMVVRNWPSSRTATTSAGATMVGSRKGKVTR